MDENTRAQLTRILNTINYMTSDDMEGQDSGLTLELVEVQLSKMLHNAPLMPTKDAVGRYCDIVDGPEDIERIAAEIDAL